MIDYKAEAFDEVLSDFDIVLDTVDGKTLSRSFTVLKKGGTLVSIKGQDTNNLAYQYVVRFEWFLMQPDGAMLADLAKLTEDGIVRPVIDSAYPMGETVGAYEAFKVGHAVGKIVIAVAWDCCLVTKHGLEPDLSQACPLVMRPKTSPRICRAWLVTMHNVWSRPRSPPGRRWPPACRMASGPCTRRFSSVSRTTTRRQ